MSDKEIIRRVIEKAYSSGWDGISGANFPTATELLSNWEWVSDDKCFGLNFGWPEGEVFALQAVIFNHDFAKALWGEEDKELWFDDYDLQDGQPLLGGVVSYPYSEGANVGFKTKAWQYHLQQMVIAENPIKYLGENI